MRRRAAKNLFSLVLGLGLASLPARAARADWLSDFGKSLSGPVEAVLGTAIVIADVTFTIHDAYLAGVGERAEAAWPIAETIVVAPQAILLDYLFVPVHASGDEDEVWDKDLAYVVPTIWFTQLPTHGIWSLASEKVRPGDLYGVSWSIAANLTFTAGAVSGAIGKRLGGRLFGLLEMVGTTPTIAVGLYKSLAKTEPDRDAWIALSAWSGALFLHGAASAVIGIPEKDAENEKPSESAFRLRLSPTLVSDGIRSAPGIVACGAF